MRRREKAKRAKLIEAVDLYYGYIDSQDIISGILDGCIAAMAVLADDQYIHDKLTEMKESCDDDDPDVQLLEDAIKISREYLTTGKEAYLDDTYVYLAFPDGSILHTAQIQHYVSAFYYDWEEYELPYKDDPKKQGWLNELGTGYKQALSQK